MKRLGNRRSPLMESFHERSSFPFQIHHSRRRLSIAGKRSCPVNCGARSSVEPGGSARTSAAKRHFVTRILTGGTNHRRRYEMAKIPQ